MTSLPLRQQNSKRCLGFARHDKSDEVMKLSKGKANPQLAGEILERKLK